MAEFVNLLEEENTLLTVKKPVSKKLEASAIIKEFDGRPVLLEKIKESEFRVAANILSSKTLVAKALGIKPEQLTKKILHAIENPTRPGLVEEARCQEVVMEEVDLDRLPILFHAERDGGNYVTAGVVIAKDPEFGQNMSFHRCMQISRNEFAIRIVPRHLYEFLERAGGELAACMCVGSPAGVLIAGACSVDIGVDEAWIANTIEPLGVVRAKTCDVLVPAGSEFVLEGTISMKKTAREGPFIDLTGTYDIVRDQPVFTIKKITHKKDAIWHAILPGDFEHKILMGVPREPTIMKEVGKVAKIVDVNIDPGGCSWLHAVVKIKKENEDDGKKAIEAAFLGHKSLKMVTVVDEDINILSPLEVQWALATRFQAVRGLVVKEGETGSSLDPSADQETRKTAKMGLDATKPLSSDYKNFEKASYPKININEFLE